MAQSSLPPVCGREVLRVVEEDDFGGCFDGWGEQSGWAGDKGEEDLAGSEEGCGEGAAGDAEGKGVVEEGVGGGGGEDFEGEEGTAVGVEVGS